ncbi:MAG UNVERIFIED_CONTAM: hypothetical protein LVR18_11540 [Planctomycetaceae bacterium]
MESQRGLSKFPSSSWRRSSVSILRVICATAWALRGLGGLQLIPVRHCRDFVSCQSSQNVPASIRATFHREALVQFRERQIKALLTTWPGVH